jgi:hypothetical protein
MRLNLHNEGPVSNEETQQVYLTNGGKSVFGCQAGIQVQWQFKSLKPETKKTGRQNMPRFYVFNRSF